MTNLTQPEFALAMMIAGSLLLAVRYWRIVLAIWLFFIFADTVFRTKDD